MAHCRSRSIVSKILRFFYFLYNLYVFLCGFSWLPSLLHKSWHLTFVLHVIPRLLSPWIFSTKFPWSVSLLSAFSLSHYYYYVQFSCLLFRFWFVSIYLSVDFGVPESLYEGDHWIEIYLIFLQMILACELCVFSVENEKNIIHDWITIII